MGIGEKALICALVLSFIFEDTGWIIAFALLDVGDAIRKKGKVE